MSGTTEATAAEIRLAQTFVQLAHHFHASDSIDDLMTRVAVAAVSLMEHCEMASVTVRDEAGYRTAASTQPAASDSDTAQYDCGQGPCLDAVDGTNTYAASFPDPRWPKLTSGAFAFGTRSVLSHHVEGAGTSSDVGMQGSLNSYSLSPDGFDTDAQQIGLILATHASIAMRSIGERVALEQLRDDVVRALSTRDVINRAKGVLMERLHLAPDEAFDVLRRSSEERNMKLSDIAQSVASDRDMEP